MTRQRPDYDELAKTLFGHLDKDALPPVDDVLRALEIAKGTKFAVSPHLLKRLAASAATPQGTDPPVDDCGALDWESCTYCDVPEDKCDACDALDCFKGLTPDLH